MIKSKDINKFNIITIYYHNMESHFYFYLFIQLFKFFIFICFYFNQMLAIYNLNFKISILSINIILLKFQMYGVLGFWGFGVLGRTL